jgi:hypothetical protein
MKQIIRQLEALDPTELRDYKKHLLKLIKNTGRKEEQERYQNVINLIDKINS